MYAKIFSQIYDGTLCTRGPWQALVTFQQLLVLADKDGVVDMTAAAIARRTTIPQEIIDIGIAELMRPDPDSRSPGEDGKRIVPLSEARAWGWRIVNYKHYRALKREEERKEYHRQYWHKRQDKHASRGANGSTNGSTTQPDTTDTTKHNSLNGNQPIAEAEAEAEAKTHTAAVAALRVSRKKPADVGVEDLVARGVNQQAAQDWLRARKAKNLPLTTTALEGVEREAAKAGLTLAQAISKAACEGWAGFKASWVAGSDKHSGFEAVNYGSGGKL